MARYPGCLLAAALLLGSGAAHAELGGRVGDLPAEQGRIRATLRAQAAPANAAYTVHELATDGGVLIREYADAGGTVFAVSWQGPVKPDLRVLLGRYFQPFLDASAAAAPAGTGPRQIRQADLVVFSGGHPRAFVGHAYVPSLVPAGVDIHALP